MIGSGALEKKATTKRANREDLKPVNLTDLQQSFNTSADEAR